MQLLKDKVDMHLKEQSMLEDIIGQIVIPSRNQLVWLKNKLDWRIFFDS